jgi:hypothetical protein
MDLPYSCRFCFEESDDYSEFISPCSCNGTMKYIHKDCLNKWFESKKQTDHYYKCQDCHSYYVRDSPENLNEKISSDLTITSILGESIITIIMILLILGCNYSNLFTTITLILLWFISVLIFSCWLYFEDIDWVFSIILIIGFISSQKAKFFIANIWTLLVYGISSVIFLNNYTQKMYNQIKKDKLINFKAKMYDRNISEYVSGVI